MKKRVLRQHHRTRGMSEKQKDVSGGGGMKIRSTETERSEKSFAKRQVQKVIIRDVFFRALFIKSKTYLLVLRHDFSRTRSCSTSDFQTAGGIENNDLFHYYYMHCRDGGTGRRPGLKILCRAIGVPVRPRFPATKPL